MPKLRIIQGVDKKYRFEFLERKFILFGKLMWKPFGHPHIYFKSREDAIRFKERNFNFL